VKPLLVLAAPQQVIADARALGVTRPVENVIEESIRAGRLPSASVGAEWPVRLLDGVIVVCKKVRVEPSGRTGWKPLAVRNLERRRAA
jgi:hypothetical protein